MKICFVGSLISKKTFDNIVMNSKIKPSNAPVNFQMMMLKGLYEIDNSLKVFSFPNVAAYPNGNEVLNGKSIETVDYGGKVEVLPMINIQGLKQITIYLSTYKYVKRWVKENKKIDKDLFVAMYSDYPPYSKAIRRVCKKYGAKSILVMTDFPVGMFYNYGKSFRGRMYKHMDNERVKAFEKYDGYILLTEPMIKGMNVENKPHMIMEGFSDCSQYEKINVTKNEKKTITYTGALGGVHCIRKLLKAFLMVKGDMQLHFYGSGCDEKYILEAAKIDKRIKFMGKVPWIELLKAQKSAHLLISIKSSKQKASDYAFPSKILEYLTSGTAVLSTKVKGIPQEYFNNMYTFDEEDSRSIAKKIEECINLPIEELEAMGKKGQKFAIENKNYAIQAKRIVEFLGEMVK